jgi:DNA polymerase-3 subunit delta'
MRSGNAWPARAFVADDGGSVWSDVVGQARAVDALRRAATAPVHAYLFLGPPGSTKDEAARAFAAMLLTGGETADSRDARLALAGEHPDVREVVRVGPAIAADQAAEIVRQAALAPVEGSRKVLILHEFHLLNAAGAGRLLKTIEEPPASTHFVVLADFVPVDLVTIASRCVRIEFAPIAAAALAARLRAEGSSEEAAVLAAAAAGGDLGRARLLAADPQFVERRRAFAELPRILDGTGATVVARTTDLLARIEAAAAPLIERHARELAELDAREQQLGTRGSGRAAIEARHRRELRRHRTDELRAGLAAIAATYRDALVDGSAPHDEAVVDAVHRIHTALEAFEHNPNETLMLQSLLWSLPVLSRP